jgi:hypothetical protein
MNNKCCEEIGVKIMEEYTSALTSLAIVLMDIAANRLLKAYGKDANIDMFAGVRDITEDKEKTFFTHTVDILSEVNGEMELITSIPVRVKNREEAEGLAKAITEQIKLFLKA